MEASAATFRQKTQTMPIDSHRADVAVLHDFENALARTGAEKPVGSVRESVHVQSPGCADQSNNGNDAGEQRRKEATHSAIQQGHRGADQETDDGEKRRAAAEVVLGTANVRDERTNRQELEGCEKLLHLSAVETEASSKVATSVRIRTAAST